MKAGTVESSTHSLLLMKEHIFQGDTSQVQGRSRERRIFSSQPLLGSSGKCCFFSASSVTSCSFLFPAFHSWKDAEEKLMPSSSHLLQPSVSIAKAGSLTEGG